MNPISFACRTTLRETPESVAERILDLSNWTDFTGYGPLPGIKSAEFEVRTPEIVGTRIRVQNTDGSSHIEEIVEWQPERRLRLQMHEFSPPLSQLAKRFDETWEFARTNDSTTVVRRFDLYAKSRLTRPVLWMISLLLKNAIARHLQQFGEPAER